MRRDRVFVSKAIAERGPSMLEGKPVFPSAPAQDRYRAELDRLIDEMIRVTERDVRRLAKSFATDAAMDTQASPVSQSRILLNRLKARFMRLFRDRAKGMADRMSNAVVANNTTQVHSSIQALTGNVSLKTSFITGEIEQQLAAGIQQNVELIRSIPEEYFLRVQGDVMRAIQSGKGEADILRTVEAAGGITKRRAKIIARDQTSKANSALTIARFKRLGIKKFKWLHSGGGKEPRPLHVAMSGNVYEIDNPPIIDERTGETGFPGWLISCRCVATPVLEFDDE